MARPKGKGVKIQITLPSDLLNRIEEDIKLNYTTKTMWFLKAAINELEKKEEKSKNFLGKKVFDLDI